MGQRDNGKPPAEIEQIDEPCSSRFELGAYSAADQNSQRSESSQPILVVKEATEISLPIERRAQRHGYEMEQQGNAKGEIDQHDAAAGGASTADRSRHAEDDQDLLHTAS